LIVRSIADNDAAGRTVDFGNGTTSRFLVAADGREFTITDAHITGGTEMMLAYQNHYEACYCVSGEGEIILGDDLIHLGPGMVYAPDKGEVHTMRALTDIHLVCVFSPALRGDETHRPQPGVPSGY